LRGVYPKTLTLYFFKEPLAHLQPSFPLGEEGTKWGPPYEGGLYKNIT